MTLPVARIYCKFTLTEKEIEKVEDKLEIEGFEHFPVAKLAKALTLLYVKGLIDIPAEEIRRVVEGDKVVGHRRGE